METAPLKSFAIWARTSLIREVTARIAVVLAPASPERVEQPNVVQALEKAVTAAGGGDKGKAAVADKVAYTWFNRIIAVRFMDANGYTGVGVVSPQVGVETGQPEILAEAKRGNFETDAVTGKTRETVTALINGTRRSDDAQGEAYALLLADYCRYWNRAMPFMFEREGDFTELLIPANLLADDSVPSRAVKVLTKDVCQDVEVIGWLYQFYIAERKDEVFAGFKKNKKAGADEIPAATQLFTPHWIVRYLVENSLGRLWMLNRPSSHLVDRMQYYIAPVDEETDFLKITRPEELKVVDPACGSGHMLTYAFDLLCAIYEEEGYAPADIPSLILTNNLYGIEIDPRAGALAAFALTMKARAKQRTFFSKQVEPNVCVLDPIHFTPDEIDFLLSRAGDKYVEAAFWNQFEHADTFGSLIQPDPDLTVHLKHHIATLDCGGDILLAHVLHQAEQVIKQAEYLSPRHSVVVTNPPYMGGGNMAPLLAEFAKDTFPTAKADLFAMFIERCIALASGRGLVAMITMQSWMYLKSFSGLRRSLLRHQAIRSMLHLGPRAFDSISGEVVSSTAFIMLNMAGERLRAQYVRLVAGNSEAEKIQLLTRAVTEKTEDAGWFEVAASSYGHIPGQPMVYWLSPAMRSTFEKGEPLSAVCAPRVGLQTGMDARFIREWWEVTWHEEAMSCPSRDAAVATGCRWFPLNRGGDSRKWYGIQQQVVNWEEDGRELTSFRPRSVIRNPDFYFLPSISWSRKNPTAVAVRQYQGGFVFSDGGPSIFPKSDSFGSEVLGFLNSSVAYTLLTAIAPTMDFEVGQIASLPIYPNPPAELADVVASLVATAKDDWDDYETSWGFRRPAIIDLEESMSLDARVRAYLAKWAERSRSHQLLETRNNELVAELYGVVGEVATQVPLERVSLKRNVTFTYGGAASDADAEKRAINDLVEELISYGVGCVFGRFSLDKPGLILAHQGATLQDYLARVPSPSFAPDKDNVIPIVDGDWFEDDIVARFRTFLRVAFGEQHFEENLRFVTEALGVKDIRDYFVRSFYKDHVQRYRKRPIYWLFSSPKGSFNALVYMHRYTPSTVSTVLNEYLREFTAKLTSSLQQQERLAAGGGTPRQQAAAQKEADRLRKVLLELEEYEHDVLYPLASRQLAIDLDDGVKANYPKFGAALKKIPGLEASDE